MSIRMAGLYVGLHGLILVGLALAVVYFRRKNHVGIGHGDHRDLRRAIRVHANAAENLPFAMLLLAICEWQGLGSIWLHSAGISILIGRSLHIYGMSRSAGSSFGRFYGNLLTWVPMLAMSCVHLCGYFWLGPLRMGDGN